MELKFFGMLNFKAIFSIQCWSNYQPRSTSSQQLLTNSNHSWTPLLAMKVSLCMPLLFTVSQSQTPHYVPTTSASTSINLAVPDCQSRHSLGVGWAGCAKFLGFMLGRDYSRSLHASTHVLTVVSLHICQTEYSMRGTTRKRGHTWKLRHQRRLQDTGTKHHGTACSLHTFPLSKDDMFQSHNCQWGGYKLWYHIVLDPPPKKKNMLVSLCRFISIYGQTQVNITNLTNWTNGYGVLVSHFAEFCIKTCEHLNKCAGLTTKRWTPKVNGCSTMTNGVNNNSQGCWFVMARGWYLRLLG